jgi:ATP diphosphatase
MSDLRDPDNGCPWDLKQDYASLVPYTLEEAYEVADAIESGDMNEVKKELGDLLFQVVFYAQLAKEEGLFDFDDIAGAIADKMVSRHPHVFSDHHYENEEAFLQAWEQQKEMEKQQAQVDNKQIPSASLMDGITQALPAMTRAVKIQKKATHIGFDWDNATDVVAVIRQELDELEAELNIELGSSSDRHIEIEDELGDVLFSCVNLARKLKIDPEQALRKSNHKFSQRFGQLEQHYHYDRQKMTAASSVQLEQIWQMIKHKDV